MPLTGTWGKTGRESWACCMTLASAKELLSCSRCWVSLGYVSIYLIYSIYLSESIYLNLSIDLSEFIYKYTQS